MSKGVIYILTNPSFPDYVKIGYAKNLEQRLRKLNQSETIPYSFRAYAVYEVEQALTDKELHKLIDTLNPDLRTIETFDGRERVKEFYAMKPEDAYNILESIAKISGTTARLKRVRPEGHEILDEQIAEEIRETSRRGPFRFSMCGIAPGETVSFVDDSSIVATVIDDRHIEYNGETTSLSALASSLKNGASVAGPMFFTYNGRLLSEIRDEIERQP